MAKLYFRFGAMGSSKTAQVLITKFNYEEKGMSVLLMKPEIDTRDGLNIVKSRIGLQSEAVIIPETFDVYIMFTEYLLKEKNYDVIIVDESQFLTERQVLQLRKIVDTFNIPVFCYGLRTDFRCKLFEGSKALFEVADSISEIKSVCKCGNKAIVNARFDSNGNIVTSGKTVDIGGNEKYEAMCYNCFSKKFQEDDCYENKVQ